MNVHRARPRRRVVKPMSAESGSYVIYARISCPSRSCPSHRVWPVTGVPAISLDAYLNCKTLEWHCPTCTGVGLLSKCLRADFVKLLPGPKTP